MSEEDDSQDVQEELRVLRGEVGAIVRRKVTFWLIRWAFGFGLLTLVYLKDPTLWWLFIPAGLLAALSIGVLLRTYGKMRRNMDTLQAKLDSPQVAGADSDLE